MKGRRIPLNEIGDLKKKLIVQAYTPGTDIVTNYVMYRLTNKYMYIPKHFCELGQVVENKVINCNFLINSEPREYQVNIIKQLHNTLIKEEGCIACLYTGWGKTFAALYLVYLLKVKTLIIVHKESLMKQWEEQIIKFLGIKPGIIQGKRVDSNHDICIGMIQSISTKEYLPEVFQDFSFTIYDETHHYCSRTFSNVFYSIGSKYNLGLTATIKRADRLEHTIEWFLGKVAVNVKLLLLEPKITIYNYYDYKDDTIRYMPNGKINTPSSITNIANLTARTDFILKLVKECYNANRNILVLTQRKSHCEEMFNKLSDYSVGKYIGGMKNEELIESNKCKIIIATYQMAEEGYDNPKLDTLIIATPKGNVEQAVGRILRKQNRNPALVIDINDCISVFNNWNRKRLSFYKSKNFKVESSEPAVEEIDEKIVSFSIRE